MKNKAIGSSFDDFLNEEGISAVNRLLDPENESITLLTLKRAAHVLGKKLRLELV